MQSSWLLILYIIFCQHQAIIFSSIFINCCLIGCQILMFIQLRLVLDWLLLLILGRFSGLFLTILRISYQGSSKPELERP